MKKALIFRGGWDGHNPIETSDMIAERLRAHGLHVDVFDTQDRLLDPEFKTQYGLVVPVWTMGTIGGDHEKALLEAIRDGMACGGWHGGMGDAFRNNTEYQFMVGGQWVSHPGGIIDYTVQVVEPDHPIMRGIPAEFPMHSEQYFMHVDPSNHVLATTTFGGEHAPWIKGTVMPVVWTRRYGKGKIFYSSLGHNFDDFENTPQVADIIVRGLLWALEEE
ncbi:MAG: ThuA domain-containing protein [Kiritimatiellia bacterium]|jgi:type 1 glutamine amidotransferase